MYINLTDIPEAIQEYYHTEVVSIPLVDEEEILFTTRNLMTTKTPTTIHGWGVNLFKYMKMLKDIS